MMHRAFSQSLQRLGSRYLQTKITPQRPRAIVSSFICSPLGPNGEIKFAIFKRSQDVLNYRGKWAVCSGSIEPADETPEAAARREILEETRLSDNDIQLLLKIAPFNIRDVDLGLEWEIHSFAWRLTKGVKSIVLDSEHTEYCFIEREELRLFDHVPLLDVGMNKIFSDPNFEP
ncbi:Bgt-2626 [Blumeria graminis f. sp. tritici]|uniref:Bgt-2626 n=2 Tax=Blumeria graminis f. sp. tritici TaxID=62690 RepID=A0A061HJ69_BLUGR|nr:hypothetical protein BGT96224_2626 [Blumeria graminis f. sp. tritici 96224]VDB93626.1 Bgt-2626 [Blumeria graminis f. sp. tritici]